MSDAPPLVLVVDDDPDVVLVCSLHLGDAGYEVAEAHTGRDALRLALDRRPAVVVLDYMLPDLDGIDVVRRFKADPLLADIPIVMLTARARERDQVLAWDAGVHDYLLKPFEGAKLVASVNSAVGTPGPRRTKPERAWDAPPSPERDRSSRLAAIVESAGDAVISETLKGEITSWNEGAERLYGWSEGEVLGSPISIIMPPEVDDMRTILDRIEQGEVIDAFEGVRLHRTGRRIHVSLRVSPIRDAAGTIVGASSIARDITDRVLLEQRFRGLVEGAPDAMVIVDGEGRIELVNRQTEIIFGHPREDLIGRKVEVLIPERYRDRHPDRRRLYARRPRTREMGAGIELHGLRADGTEFPVEISLSPLSGDQHASYAATIRDVTDRKSAEAKFRGLLEAAPDAIVGVDVHGKIVLVNAQTEALFGYTRDELIGQQVELLVPAKFRAAHPAHREKYVKEPGRRAMGRGLDLVARRRDGSEFPAEISLSSIEADEGIIISAAIRDVTERKQAEARFRALVEAAPDAMVISGTDGIIQLVNAQAVRLFGYEREELVGKPVDMLVPTRFRDRHPHNRAAYGRNPRTRPMGADLELYALRKDGTEVPVEISLSPIETDQGPTISASIRDVTSRRQTEETMALAFEREREASNRLREVDRLRSDFLSTVSHELRTPLTAIKGFAEWLVGSWDTTPDERKKDMVARMLHAGGRLDFLIQDLLDFSRLERGHLKVDVGPHRLSAIVTETLRHAQPALEDHWVEVDVDESTRVEADQGAMMRVLENLLTNAAKFSPQGSTIRITSSIDGDWVTLSVCDEGMGIPESERDKVFDRFYRVPETAAVHPGTGIGLAIVKQFMEAQGGEVRLVSGPGEGSEFQLVLRRSPA